MRDQMKLVVWFALLLGCPAFLGMTSSPIEQLRSSSSFASYYWMISAAGIAVFLIPPAVLNRVRTSSRMAGLLGKAEVVGFALAVAWFSLSLLSPVVLPYVPANLLSVQARYSIYRAVVFLAPWWFALSVSSMALCVLAVRIRARSRDAQAPHAAGHFALLLTLSIATGSLRAFAGIPFSPQTWYRSIESYLGAPFVHSSPIAMAIPAAVIALTGASLCRYGRPRSLQTWFTGVLYGELAGRLLTRIVPGAAISLADNPLLAAFLQFGCCVLLTLDSVLVHSRKASSSDAPCGSPGPQQELSGPSPIPNNWNLSNRELEAASHAVAGQTSKVAAADMGISASTVRNLQSRAWKKMGVSSVQEARKLLGQMNPPDTPENSKAPDQPVDSRCSAASLALLSVAIASILPWQADTFPWLTPLNASTSFGMGALGAFLFVRHTWQAARATSCLHLTSPPLLACVCALLARIVTSPALLSIAALATGWACAALILSMAQDDAHRSNPWPICIAALVVSFPIGCQYYLSWRQSAWPHLSPFSQTELFPVLLTCILCAGSLPFVQDSPKRRRAVATGGLLVLVSIIAAMCNLYTVLLACLIASAIIMFVGIKGAGMFETRLARCIVIDLCAGELLGTRIINEIERSVDLARWIHGLTAALTYQRNICLVAGIALVCTLVAATVIAVEFGLLLRRKLATSRYRGLPDKRAEYALHAKGLTDLEVTVLTGTLEGKTCRDVAALVGYAPSTVYSIRRGAYRKLGVHGIDGVLKRILQVIDA